MIDYVHLGPVWAKSVTLTVTSIHSLQDALISTLVALLME